MIHESNVFKFMKHPQSWFLGVVIAFLLFFIFFMPMVGTRVRGLLGPQVVAPNDAEQLAAENVSLKAQLAKVAVIMNELPTSTPDTIRAMVYSHYPLNFKNELTVDAGTSDGVAVKDAVIFQGNLVGVVEQSSAHGSVVQTIADPNFKLPVRIGPKGYDALLVGGSYPQIETIAKTATIATGDVVVSVATGTPYGIAVGTVQNAVLAPDNLFKEASLVFPYDIGMIQTVLIVKQ